MVFKKTSLIPLDRAGFYNVSVIHMYNRLSQNSLGIGSFVLVKFKKKNLNFIVSEKNLLRGIIIYTKYGVNRFDGSYFLFKFNSLVVLKKRFTPVGSEVYGVGVREINYKKFLLTFINCL